MLKNINKLNLAEPDKGSLRDLPRHWWPVNHGEKNGRSKLTTEKVILIIKLLKSGVGVPKIAKVIRISETTVRDIRDNKAWIHIDRNAIEAHVNFKAEMQCEKLDMS